MHIEREKNIKVHEINSVNLFSESGCSRQQVHSLAVPLSLLRKQSVSSNREVFQTHHYCHWMPCSPREHVLAPSDTVLVHPCLFHGEVKLNDVKQDGGVIILFSSKDFLRLASALEAKSLASIQSLYKFLFVKRKRALL